MLVRRSGRKLAVSLHMGAGSSPFLRGCSDILQKEEKFGKTRDVL